MDLARTRRFFYVLTAFCFLFSDLPAFASLADAFYLPVSFFKYLPWKSLGTGYLYLFYAWLISLLLAGWSQRFTKIYSGLAFLLGALVLGYPNNFGKIDHVYNLLCITLFTFFLSYVFPQAEFKYFRNFFRRTHWLSGVPWPLLMIQMVTGLFYFEAGFQKLSVSGIHWISSNNLQNILLIGQKPAGEYLASMPALCSALAGGAVVLEIGSLLAFASANTILWWFFPVSWAAMHIINWILLGPFFLVQILNFIAWVPVRPGPSDRPAQRSSAAPDIILGFLILFSLYQMIDRQDSWPFSEFDMYSEDYSIAPYESFSVDVFDDGGRRLDLNDALTYPLSEARYRRAFRKAYERKNTGKIDALFSELAQIIERNQASGDSKFKVAKLRLHFKVWKNLSPIQPKVPDETSVVAEYSVGG